jgi:CRP-like cAMP-binding protein
MKYRMRNPTGLDQFRNAMTNMVDIPDTEWEALVPHLSERRFDKNDYLVRAGDVVNSFYFILKGLVRFFYGTEDGKEFNKHFAMEKGFAGSFHSFVLHAPCGFYIQALEHTATIVLPNNTMHAFCERHVCWERLSRKHAEHLLLLKEAREKELLLDSLEVRYQRFLREFPGLADRMPQYHIASYLGVTDVALSRIRKKITQ